MGCEINYTYEGTLCGCLTTSLEEDKENTQYIIDRVWRELLALAAATPPEQATSEVNTKYPYCEFLAEKLRELREDLEDSYRHLTHIEEVEQVLRESPDKVQDLF